jgi:hypothetical protein
MLRFLFWNLNRVGPFAHYFRFESVAGAATMSDNGRDFWSDEIIVEAAIVPEVILREQAGILAEKTKGIVRGEVETIEQPAEKVDDYLKPVFSTEAELKQYTHTLYLVVPALDNYRYALVSAEHDFEPYPCKAAYHPRTNTILDANVMTITSCGTPEELVHWLARTLKHPTTTRIIRALISRASQPRQAALASAKK